MKGKKKIGLIAAAAAVIIAAGIFAFYSSATGAVDPGNDTQIKVEIPQGSSTGSIAAILKEEGTIESEFIFRLKSKLGGFDGEYKAGLYGLSKDMTMEEQMKMICEGKTLGSFITVTEGMNTVKIGEMLESQDIVTAEEFYREAENGDFDYDFLKGAPEGPGRLEGFLYPETYRVEPGDTAHDIIDRMLAQFEKVYESVYKDAVKKSGRSINEIMTVASIVEREARVDEDKKNVASVIYNRLEIDMPLQMDSILAYITGEDKIKASLDDTKVESDYNPYQNKGLPPGPICSPGSAAIEAAINPPETDYLYFVATEKLDGTNVFSETYEDFLKNKEKFDKAYREYIKENPDKK